MSFASLTIQYAELLLVIAITVIQYDIIQNRQTIVYILSQLTDYNTNLFQLLSEKEIQLDATHQKEMKNSERLILAVVILSLILPAGIVLACTHPIEPTHILMEDLFEMSFGHDPQMLPLILPFLAATFNATNSIIVLCFLMVMYSATTVNCLKDITPIQQASQPNAAQYHLETSYYGILEDSEIIRMYRTQQVRKI